MGKIATTAGLVLTLGFLAFSSAASAQYGFAEMWDAEAPVLLKGEVIKVEWVEPNAQLHMVDEATDVTWIVEGGSPGAVPAHWRERFQPGVRVVVRGYQAKDKRCLPACRANGRDVTFADGAPPLGGPGARDR